ncbi:hypothetical protein [Acetobacter sp. DsW_063]|uniref:hypothetical protein n=1 Tax=Acetobacter sp. DsW_063 TaxID=1514894 RepID=UPI000A3C5FCC|nr:hypothetical protein [Acetobacter sp. DsW_063]OUJ17074.1 hypothetical protein HK28_07855 [Acetobacter sp. DsW_063]
MTISAPHTISWLVDAVGDDVALQFLESCAGQRLTVPMKADGSRLASLYGEDVARAICARHGGLHWFVPTCKSWRVAHYARMGMTVNEMAQRAGITFQGVHALLKSGGGRPPRERSVDPRQPDLF